MPTRVRQACLVAFVVVAGLACNKQEAAQAAAPPPAQDNPAAAAAPSEKPRSSGLTIPGTNDLDPCAVVTAEDLQPVLGKVTRKDQAAMGMGEMSMCAYQRDGGDVMTTIVTSASLAAMKRKKNIQEFFPTLFKQYPKEAVEKVEGAGDEAVTIPLMAGAIVRKGDVIYSLLVMPREDKPSGVTPAKCGQMAHIIAGKLAALPTGTGAAKATARPTASATHTTVDVCGLVSDEEASVILGEPIKGKVIRGRMANGPFDACEYDNKYALEAISLIALTKASFTDKSLKFEDYVKSFSDNPLLKGGFQKVDGLGDEAVIGKSDSFVRSKDVVLQIKSDRPPEKLKLFVKKALERL